MKRADKQDAVVRLADRLATSPNFYLADFTGLSVKRMTELRRRFRAQGAEFLVVKNTLARRAFRDASLEGLDDLLRGPTAVVFAGDDAITPAKVITDFQREEADKPALKAGLVDGRRVDASQIKRLARLPTRDELMSQVAGALHAPLHNLAMVMNGVLYQVVGVLEALRAQREETA
jgi:large subunit ribosomal protein L10